MIKLDTIEESWMNLDSVRDVLRLVQHKSLEFFPDITWHIWVWHCGSSIFIHGICGLICFYLLRKHKFGRLFSILILIWGVLMPFTGGLITTMFLSGVNAASNIKISPLVACFFGCGQTLFWIVIGVSRILATL